MANSSKMRERRKIQNFHGEGGELGLQARVVYGAHKGSQGFPIARGEGPLKLKQGDGEGGCVCVRSSTLQASMKDLRSFTHKELESAFFIHKDLFLY